jgi:hypothetical protein
MGAASVEPAPLIEPLTFDAPDELDALDEVDESSLLPHAARPSASRAAAPAASHWLDLTSEHLIEFVALVRPQASSAPPCSLLPTRRWNVKSV